MSERKFAVRERGVIWHTPAAIISSHLGALLIPVSSIAIKKDTFLITVLLV